MGKVEWFEVYRILEEPLRDLFGNNHLTASEHIEMPSSVMPQLVSVRTWKLRGRLDARSSIVATLLDV
jgi:hypothetical protein